MNERSNSVLPPTTNFTPDESGLPTDRSLEDKEKNRVKLRRKDSLFPTPHARVEAPFGFTPRKNSVEESTTKSRQSGSATELILPPTKIILPKLSSKIGKTRNSKL